MRNQTNNQVTKTSHSDTPAEMKNLKNVNTNPSDPMVCEIEIGIKGKKKNK